MDILGQENIDYEVNSFYLQEYKYSVGDSYTYEALTDSILDNGGNYLEFGGRELLPYFLLIREEGNKDELYKISLELREESFSLYQNIVNISKCEKVPLSAYSLEDYCSTPKVSFYLFKLNELDIVGNYMNNSSQCKCVIIAKILERSLHKKCEKVYFSKFPRHKNYHAILFDFIDFYIEVDRYFLKNLSVEEVSENIFGLKSHFYDRFITGNFFYKKVCRPVPEGNFPFMEKKEGVWRF